jgi:GntR family transcriptional regulator/MocR family aminotransferase
VPLTKHGAGSLPWIRLDPGSGLPIYEQLYRALRDLVIAGGLSAGTQLASTRSIAAELGISRFTTVTAMDRLLTEGYLTARRGSGTFVAHVLPERMMRPARGHGVTRASEIHRDGAPKLSARGRALSGVVITGPRLDRGETRPFHPRRPALDAFPVSRWAALVRRQWKTYRHQHLDYGDPAGYLPLRTAIAEHIGVTRGVRCAPRQVIVTSGAQQAFDILFRLLLDPGDRAWIEEPGYLDVRAALVGAGARLVAVPVDAQGLNVAEGSRLARDARLAVVSPAHQYPTGVTLSMSRRAELIAWARAAGAWIIEDDYDSYFRYHGRPLSALHRFESDVAGESRVIYVGTFSKTMFPSLRLGFCVVPEGLVDAVANARAVADRNSPIADQAALAEFVREGEYDRHLRRARLIYRERYDAIRHHFKRLLAGVVSLSPAAAGTHVLGWLEKERAAAQSESLAVRVARAAEQEDLVIFPLSRYCLERPARDALVLGYGGLTPRQIAAGTARLARVIERVVQMAK